MRHPLSGISASAPLRECHETLAEAAGCYPAASTSRTWRTDNLGLVD